jgi:hypothetical protein
MKVEKITSKVSWMDEELASSENCECCGGRNEHGGLYEYNHLGSPLLCSGGCYKKYWKEL